MKVGAKLLKHSASLFLKFSIGVLMCLFVFMSFEFAITAAFSDTVGYNIYHFNKEIGKEEQICQHDADNKNDVDCKCSEYSDEELSSVRITELSQSKKNISAVLSQIFSIVLVGGVIYGTVWDIGNKDISAVKYGNKTEDKMRGVIIGLFAAIPSVIIYILLVLSKLEIMKPEFLNTYRLFNAHFHGVLTYIYSGAKSATDLSVFKILCCGLLQLYLPLISGVAYFLGYKDIKISEKIVYKKK